MHGFPVNAETETITIVRGYTPPQHRHTPDSVYARYFTVPAIGCAAFLLWERLNDYLPTQPGASIELGWNELTRTLGLTPGRGAKVLARLVDFHLVEQIPADSWFAVRSAAPTLKPAQLERLAVHCPQLAASHSHVRLRYRRVNFHPCDSEIAFPRPGLQTVLPPRKGFAR